MRTRWHRDDAAQSMILVALAVVVLLGALALAVDWGYALTQRRVMQTSSDAAALGVGRYLATSVIEVEGSPAFTVTQESAWCVADRLVRANDAFRPTGASPELTLQFGTDSDPIVWTDATAPVGCPADGLLPVPANTMYVRAHVEMTYRSLVAGVIGFPTTTAAASARAKLSGTAVPTSGPVWPMVRQYDKADFDMACPPQTCDPTEMDPITFWSPQEDSVVFGNFKGLVDFSRDSTRFDAPVRQIFGQWDMTGSRWATPNATPAKADWSGNCGGLWDTVGGEDPQQQNKQCSLPNWFYHTFQGALSLTRNWIAATPAGQEAPSTLTAREVCDPSQRPDPAPSCDDVTVGDWVETVPGGVEGTNISDNMRALIRTSGFTGAFSDRSIENGPNRGEPYGKALIVLVYLWDCAEAFDQSAPLGAQWSLVLPEHGERLDCSAVPRTGSAPTPDRVHLFTAAPFTFYEGLVTSQAIQGYWGGAFGDSRDCQACPLNPLANTAFLVADDE